MDYPLTSFQITDQEFGVFKDLVYQLMGINLNETKKMLLVSRLSKRLRVLRLSTFTEYYEYLTMGPGAEAELGEFMNLITTNKTDFYREKHHFDLLERQILPELAEACQRKTKQNIRIWSAGCSTGEEPYTMAMVVDRFLARQKLRTDIRILATDIDTTVLDTARKGLYKKERLSGIPEDDLERYFTVYGSQYQVKEQLKSLITFGRFNLTHPFPFKHGFDVIFCRNVLIYFTPADRRAMVQHFVGVLRPRGYLALGHSESLVTENTRLQTAGMTLYRLGEA